MADDLDIDLERMQHWTKDQAVAYFESGGEKVPADGIAAVQAPASEPSIESLSMKPKLFQDFLKGAKLERVWTECEAVQAITDVECEDMMTATKDGNVAALEKLGMSKKDAKLVATACHKEKTRRKEEMANGSKIGKFCQEELGGRFFDQIKTISDDEFDMLVKEAKANEIKDLVPLAAELNEKYGLTSLSAVVFFNGMKNLSA